jgi:DNA-binding response OmpR family regulator
MNPWTLLVVEDDPAVRNILVTALDHDTFSVLEAGDGLQAIQLLDDRRVAGIELDLILLDLMLPRLDGLAVLNHVTAHNHTAPVIAISASQWYVQAAKAAGARAILRKPFDLNELLDLVEHHCKNGSPSTASRAPGAPFGL